jgi:hypothetical protein
MFVVGLAMLGLAVAMVVVAQPQNGEVVPWLRSETSQQWYGFALLIVLSVGGLLVVTWLT